MTIQRCAHLKPDDVAAPYRAMGIAMELCVECRAEMDERLGEKPLSGETPIEKAAQGVNQQNRGGGFDE